MARPGLSKSMIAGGAIAPYTVVKFSADDTVVAAAAATDLLVGVTTEVAAASGERADVVLQGIADVVCGGTVARGKKLTADANGNVVEAAPSAGANNQILGIAMRSAVAGDIVPVLINQSTLQG